MSCAKNYCLEGIQNMRPHTEVDYSHVSPVVPKIMHNTRCHYGQQTLYCMSVSFNSIIFIFVQGANLFVLKYSGLFFSEIIIVKPVRIFYILNNREKDILIGKPNIKSCFIIFNDLFSTRGRGGGQKVLREELYQYPFF